MKKSCLILITLLLLCAVKNVNGQQYNFHHYNVENGFPQANADEIIQDHLGYIWITTQVGAVRFDGTDYHILNEENGLPNNLTSTLYLDSKNQLWIGTRKGLALYNYDTIVAFGKKHGLVGNWVRHVWEDKYGKLWVMTDKGLCFKNDTVFECINLPIPDQTIQCHVQKDNHIILGTTSGLIRQTGDTTFEIIQPELRSYSIEDIDYDTTGSLWIATQKNGLYRITNNRIKKIQNQNTINSPATRELLCDNNGEMWVGTEGNGMFRYDGKQFHQYSTRNGMFNSSVLELVQDKEGNIWIGGRNGIVVYNPTNPFTHYPMANKGNKETVFGMLLDSKHNYWFASYGGGLSKYDGEKWTYYTKKDGLGDNRLFSLLEDPKHNIWISTAGHGIVKFNGHKFEVFDSDNGFLNARVFKIIQDSDQNIWACMQFEGIAKYDGHKFRQYTTDDGLPDNSVMSAELDTSGNIWFGTIGNGIFIRKDNKFIVPQINTDAKPTYIRSIVRDSTGTIWLGTASMGACRLTKQKNGSYNLESFTTKDGLNSDNIYFLFCDDNDQIWAGTEKGINRITFDRQREIKQIYTYGKAEGFKGVETSINGAMMDHMGNLWFASIIGATKYEPGVEQQNNVEPQTHITGLKLFYQNTNWEIFTDKTDVHQLPVGLKLAHNQNHLTFQFDALSFTNPDQVFYQYKLKGLDSKWSPKTRIKEAVYANIPPGDYTFMVKACNNDGLWNKQATKFSFEITPPFWQTTWFYIVASLTLVFLIIFYIHFRISQYKKAQHILEQKVEDRTKEIAQQKNEIQEKNEELNQRNEEIAAQRDEIEEQKNRIEDLFRDQTNSIKYARHIQKAILPNTTLFKEELKNHFIFFRPQSIVSGDFYYIAIHREWIIISAVDSTGHGVPGGFMSMLGMSFMNEIIYSMQDIQVDIVLNKLRKYIIRSLKQKGKPGEHKEGLEMALIAINKRTLECQYEGASSPLLLVRNNSKKPPNAEKAQTVEANTLYRFTPDNMPISIYPKMQPFRKHTFNLIKGDKLYLFTDGFIDQYGGQNIKKVSSKQFQQLILKTATLEMPEQKKQLITFYDNWKSNQLQIDDVLVLGLEI